MSKHEPNTAAKGVITGAVVVSPSSAQRPVQLTAVLVRDFYAGRPQPKA